MTLRNQRFSLLKQPIPLLTTFCFVLFLGPEITALIKLRHPLIFILLVLCLIVLFPILSGQNKNSLHPFLKLLYIRICFLFALDPYLL